MAETTPAEVVPETQSMTVVYDVKQVQQIQAASGPVLTEAKDFAIETEDDYTASSSFLSLVAERIKKVDTTFEKPIKDAFGVHRFLTGLRNTLLMPYQQADKIVKERRRDWRNQKEREDQIRNEQERQKAKEEADARALEEAAELASAGEQEAADIIIQRAADAPPPPVIIPSSIPKETGHTVRKFWAFRIVNATLIKREFMEPDEVKIRAIVSKLGKDAVSIIGGIKVYQDETESTRVKK